MSSVGQISQVKYVLKKELLVTVINSLFYLASYIIPQWSGQTLQNGIIMGGKNLFLSGTVDLKLENFLPALLFFRSNQWRSQPDIWSCKCKIFLCL